MLFLWSEEGKLQIQGFGTIGQEGSTFISAASNTSL